MKEAEKIFNITNKKGITSKTLNGQNDQKKSKEDAADLSAGD